MFCSKRFVTSCISAPRAFLPRALVRSFKLRAFSHSSQVRARLEELYREEGVPAVREEYEAKVREALEVRDLLMRNTEEMDSVVKALNGELGRPRTPPFFYFLFSLLDCGDLLNRIVDQ